jgi:hypothetical protein
MTVLDNERVTETASNAPEQTADGVPANEIDDILDDVEVDVADAVEQHAEVVPEGDEQVAEIPLDVNPADAVEQRRSVGGDDEDYR